MITPRSHCAQGFIDSNKEDYTEEADPMLKKNQDTQVVIIEDKWVDGYKVRVYKA
jgi:hypothetical protein